MVRKRGGACGGLNPAGETVFIIPLSFSFCKRGTGKNRFFYAPRGLTEKAAVWYTESRNFPFGEEKGEETMKTVKNKQILMAADFAGYPLKEAIKEYLEKKGWEVTDIGVRADSDPNDTELMFHRIGLRVGAMITEKEFDRAMIFCGTGMGIHIAASKCPRVHAGVVESVPAALRAITGNGVNVLAMGAFYVAPAMGCDIADAYLNAELGSGYEWWHNFYEFHKLAMDELDAFDYETFKKNGFKVEHLGDYPLKLETKD